MVSRLNTVADNFLVRFGVPVQVNDMSLELGAILLI